MMLVQAALLALLSVPAHSAGAVGVALSDDLPGIWRMQNMTALKAALLANYDATTAPLDSSSNRGVTVRMQLGMDRLLSVDTKEEQMQIYGWWRHDWLDPRLKWTPSDWDGISLITLRGGAHVWLPELTMYGATVVSYLLSEDQEAMIYSDGSVWVSRPLVHTFPCEMDMRNFPFDTQVCEFTWGSWTYDAYTIQVVPRTAMPALANDDSVADIPFVFTADFDEPTEFDLIKVDAVTSEFTYGCCPEPYSIITYRLYLRRQHLAYTAGIVAPIVLATFAGFSTFIINPGAGERIGLGVTIVLATAAIYIVAHEVLPKGNQYTMILVLYTTSFALSVFTLIVSVFSVSLCFVKESEGLLSETNLLKTFIDADADGSGDLSREEIERMLRELGVNQDKIGLFKKTVEQQKLESITFPQWYELCGILGEHDGLASHHSPLIGFILKPFIAYERKQRKDFVVRRAQLAIEENRVSKKLATQTKLKSRTLFSSQSLSQEDDSDGRETPQRTLRGATNMVLRKLRSGADQDRDAPNTGQVAPTHRVVVSRGRNSSDDSPRETKAEATPLAEEARAGEARGAKLVTEHDLVDPTTRIGRTLAGWIDTACVVVIPSAYAIFILVLFWNHRNAQEENKGTTFTASRQDLDGTVTSSSSFCCFNQCWIDPKYPPTC